MSKRELCPLCSRPLVTCICAFAHKIDNQIEVIILQHPLEQKESKNTAGLLHLCLNHSELHIGESFDDAFFARNRLSPKLDVLLYPPTPESASLGIQAPPELALSRVNLPIRLWILDATWRKSRKMLYLNIELQRMPRLDLTDCPPSLYEIRKAQGEHQLSTLEACCYALRQLEHNQVDYTPILDAFKTFITDFKSRIPHHLLQDRP